MKSETVARVLAIAFALLLSACTSGRGGNIPYNVQNFGPPDAPQVVSSDAVYKLAPLDTVSVLVFDVPQLSGDYVVDQSGVLTMPLIGKVQAVGLSTNELSAKVESGLQEKYLRDPDVTIALKESLSRVVTVDGSVVKPGIYPIRGNSLTLIQAIAAANGTNELANPHRVAVYRVIDGRQVAAAFDLESIRDGEEKNPQIYAGDTIIVDGSGLKQAQRDILQSLPLASTLLFAF
ncbi:polysaccharide biosynthesis/export family protein [Novosphingopyxis sp. YJ-S2-01]|uniref:polysaccharide biosynthesis/export family protein n=1 Tax=Novosphingopyxis sp. YJ-S2-01 TaxID=2794021 RepID=UPI0018DC4EB1|nr:polysaccharide biosynthesis/export family protein [Novosphingopyxis sp. YJ-S2-01]MBH9538429.1 polysaccharide export protein [Novosphingopyxis sp. YJ-S2-01]